MKRYYIRYESDKVVCGSNEHNRCYSSTLKTAKSIANRTKKEYSEENARNIRVYDMLQEDENGHALVVYQVN